MELPWIKVLIVYIIVSKKDKTNIDIIDKFLFQDGADAYDIEQFIIKDNNNCKYIGENVLVSGNSELFTTDIMQYK